MCYNLEFSFEAHFATEQKIYNDGDHNNISNV